MIVFNPVEQAILQIVICFSVLNTVFMITLNKEKSFPKLFGLSFLTPLSLGLLTILYSTPGLKRTFYIYLDLAFLLVLLLLAITWYRKYYSGSLILLFSFPVMFIILICKIPAVPSYLLSPSFHAGAAIILTVIAVYLFRKWLKEKNSYITWGVIILGFSQALPSFIPGKMLALILFGEFTAYFLFFLYIIQNSAHLCMAKLKKAEAKLADINKTINREVKKQVFELERHNKHLISMTQKDPLVDAYNKKGILNLLRDMAEEPGSERFTILLFDIDNFKNINDTLGHMTGDVTLKKIATIARGSIRGFDYLGRFGGDEFIMILLGTTLADALYVAERFRKSVREDSEVSVSIGVAAFPEDGRTVQEILEVADAGLYESKRKGKNAVTHYNPKRLA